MIVKAAVDKLSTILITIGALCLCGVVIIYSKACSQGALSGIEMCLKVLVPSLFPFMAISSFIVKSGIANTIGKPFKRVMQRLFGLDGCFAPIILLSLIGGYPVGAKGIYSLYKSGCASLSQCKRASLFAICGGPGFMINFVGMSLYNNTTIGAVILVSQIISVILLGLAVNIFSKDNFSSDTESSSKSMPLGNAIVESTYEGAKGILNICAFVVLFSAITAVIGVIVGDGMFKNSILLLLEVCSAISTLSKNCPIEVIAFAAGFGGLCVHFQIFSALGEIKINKLLFFCFRIIQGAITGVLTHFGIKLFACEQMVFSTAVVEQTDISGGTIISGIVLVAVSVCFLYTLKNRTA